MCGNFQALSPENQAPHIANCGTWASALSFLIFGINGQFCIDVQEQIKPYIPKLKNDKALEKKVSMLKMPPSRKDHRNAKLVARLDDRFIPT